MSIPIGSKVRRDDRYARVGTLLSVADGIALIKYSDAPGGFLTGAIRVAEMVHVCSETVGSRHRYPCGRPVKEGNLCGVHAEAERRRREASAKYVEEHRLKAEGRIEMKRLIAAYDMEDRAPSIRIQSVEHQTVTLTLDDLLSLAGAGCNICGKAIQDRAPHLCPEHEDGGES